MLIIPFGIYKCPKCRQEFVWKGEPDSYRVMCPCGNDLTPSTRRLTEAAKRGFEGVQYGGQAEDNS